MAAETSTVTWVSITVRKARANPASMAARTVLPERSSSRIREELRSGKTVRAAIEAGFARAFRTVIDTHVTVLVSAAILYQFGTGPVKGFAVTLAIGIFASLFTEIG